MDIVNLIRNSELNCFEKYTKVSSVLKTELDLILDDIEKFYYSDFWINRFKRRLKEECIKYNPIQLDIILGTSTCLKEDNVFKVFNEDPILNGISNLDTMIALNVNLDKDELNYSHIENVVMHEFGHRQYNLKEFKLIEKLNNIVFKNPKDHIIDNTLTDNDIKYFTSTNEIRLRIIPIIKEMIDYKLTSEEIYNQSLNLKIDDIKTIFDKNYILTLIENIL